MWHLECDCADSFEKYYKHRVTLDVAHMASDSTK